MINSIDRVGTYIPPFFNVANPDGGDSWQAKMITLIETLFTGTGDTATVTLAMSNSTDGAMTLDPSKSSAVEVAFTFLAGVTENP